MTQVDTGTLEAETPGSLPGYDGNPAYGTVCVASGGRWRRLPGTGWDASQIRHVIEQRGVCGQRKFCFDVGTGTFSYDTGISDSQSGALGVVVMGSGVLILTGSSTASGGTTVLSGTLELGDGTTDGSLTGDIADNGALVFNNQAALICSGVISGTGSVTTAGCGVVTVNGANTYLGGTDVEYGTNLQVGDLTALGSGSLIVDGTLDLNGCDLAAGLLSSQTNEGVITNSNPAATNVLSVQPSEQRGVLGRYPRRHRRRPRIGHRLRQRRAGRPGRKHVFRPHHDFMRPVRANEFQQSAHEHGPHDRGGGTVDFDPSLACSPPGSGQGLGLQGGGGLGASDPTDPGSQPDSAPVLTAIQCVGQSPLIDANVVTFAVGFSKPVTGVSASDFTVVGGAGGSVTSVSGSGAVLPGDGRRNYRGRAIGPGGARRQQNSRLVRHTPGHDGDRDDTGGPAVHDRSATLLWRWFGQLERANLCVGSLKRAAARVDRWQRGIFRGIRRDDLRYRSRGGAVPDVPLPWLRVARCRYHSLALTPCLSPEYGRGEHY